MPQANKPQPIALICGLGNPGEEYAHTRHNIGFATVDVLARRAGVSYWKSEAGCMVAHAVIGGRQVLLAKPQDFMNTSGGPLSKLMRQEHLAPAQILVVHDEVDLPAGQVRAKWGGGLNAHNGLRSIANKLGTRDFSRIRCGIGRPPGKMQVADYVLRELKGGFLEEFQILAQDAASLCEQVVRDGMPTNS
ncbi:MAG: aminoacyl-tRNA hydrolase [Tractidigestivibacter sp.]|jgi:PTH1 family peptidyl-tRNA hydrolase|uniref:aminoacyl-tRNA hydrolase n=1 Tax=Tractidigestivibacter sp. TaxID=2847320 RepID=UPI003D94425F